MLGDAEEHMQTLTTENALRFQRIILWEANEAYSGWLPSLCSLLMDRMSGVCTHAFVEYLDCAIGIQ